MFCTEVIGHILGCDTNIESVYERESHDADAYGYGYRRCNGTSSPFVTLMSYRCHVDVENWTWQSIGKGTRIPYFSNPNLFWCPPVQDNPCMPMGIAGESDNARVIRDNKVRRPNGTNTAAPCAICLGCLYWHLSILAPVRV